MPPMPKLKMPAGQRNSRNECNGVAEGAGRLPERRNGFGRDRRG